MRYVFGKNHWKTMEQGEEECFLLANGLGGFSSLSVIGSNVRGDHALFMGAAVSPNKRVHMVTNLHERIISKEETYELASQRFVTSSSNLEGYRYLNHFSYEYLPKWQYQAGSFCVEKTVVMPHFKNMIGVFYEVMCLEDTPAKMILTPWMRRTTKDDPIQRADGKTPENSSYPLYLATNGEVKKTKVQYSEAFYFAKDACDGREAYGYSFADHEIICPLIKGTNRFYVLYSMEPLESEVKEEPYSLIEEEIRRLKVLEEGCGLKSPAAKMLARSADAYLVKRESTKEMTVIAGYPFFGDWGRDTMIALPGCTLAAGQYSLAKSILRSFMQYCHKGLMPNLFPEGEKDPLYNTVDASLLFINSVYLYVKKTGDEVFLKEALPVMEDIVNWYQKGTDYNIHMDEDGLLIAGEGLWQVTWMDVRYQDILPTPRHGKPVEINAYWYNALKILSSFGYPEYDILAEKVKKHFLAGFWNEKEECLRDVLSGTEADNQIRCNQIWALTMPFTMLDEEKGRAVLKTVYTQLYTPVGLRSLSYLDRQFHPMYSGSNFKRDMAYHQGTVWAFPLGAFFIGWIRFARDQKEAAAQVMEWLLSVEAAMGEGCLGHLAEIYDGLCPNESRGCFAQAWSVGELLNAYAYAEERI